MKIKFCGVKNRKNLNFIKENAVDFVGLNFVRSSRRKVGENFFGEISVGAGLVPAQNGRPQGAPLLSPKMIALFCDADLEFVFEILEQCPIFWGVQLHGSESIEFVGKIRKKFPQLKIWKAFSAKLQKKSHIFLENYLDLIDLALLDGSIPGSGQEISDKNWLESQLQILRKNKVEYGVAGGINRDNIKNFRANFPDAYLLDTASGIEENGEFSEEVAKELLKNFGK